MRKYSKTVLVITQGQLEKLHEEIIYRKRKQLELTKVKLFFVIMKIISNNFHKTEGVNSEKSSFFHKRKLNSKLDFKDSATTTQHNMKML